MLQVKRGRVGGNLGEVLLWDGCAISCTSAVPLAGHLPWARPCQVLGMSKLARPAFRDPSLGVAQGALGQGPKRVSHPASPTNVSSTKHLLSPALHQALIAVFDLESMAGRGDGHGVLGML